MALYHIKLYGNTTNSTSGATTAEIGIYGIHPKWIDEGEMIQAWTGSEQKYPAFRAEFTLECVEFSTVAGGDQTTENIRDIVNGILLKKYLFLGVPSSPKRLPPRWRDTVNFPDIGTVFATPIAVNHDGDVDMSADWGKSREKTTLIFRKKTRES